MVNSSPTNYLASNMAMLDPAAAGQRLLAASAAGHARAAEGPALGTVEIQTARGGWVSLHSRRAPVQEARNWLADATASAPDAIVIIGPGLGYCLEAIDERFPSARVLVLEPDAAVARLLFERRNLEPWLRSGRLRFLIGPDYPGMADAWRHVAPDGRAPAVLVNPVLERERPQAVEHARRALDAMLDGARANAEARRQFAGRYLLNTIRNLPHIERGAGANTLFGRFAGTPAVLIGAGPSLDGVLGILREVGDRALLIAVDTALGPLLEAGITPHIVIAADPQPVNARHLTTVPAPSDVWLIAEGSLAPETFGPWADRTFFFAISDHQPWPWLESLGIARSPLQIWGSVVTSQFDLALRLGCDPIIFTGLDLAFTGGQPYCRNTIYEKDWAPAVAHGMPIEETWRAQRERHQLVSVLDVHGRPTETAPHLVAFRDWLVEKTAAAGQTRRIINATGGGIFQAPHLPQASLADIVGALPTGAARKVPMVLASSHEAGRLRRHPVGLALARVVVDAVAGHTPEPLPSWRAFASDTVSAREILAAINDALALTCAAMGRAEPQLATSETR